MANIQVTVEELNAMQPLEIIKSEAVRARFIQIHNTLWGDGTGEPAYEREAIHFTAILREKQELQKATRFSIFTSFIDLAVCGLSLEPGVRALCYLQGRNVKVGKDPQTGKDIYEGHLVLTVSGYGELVLRARAGQIRHADNPVLVYEEDSFSFTDNNGRKEVSYTCNLPHTSNRIIAGYLRITRNDGSIDYSVMFEEDWMRLKDYSAKQNRRWNNDRRQWEENPNALYTSRGGAIDSGFLCAKIIKHAFNTYPKIRIGKAQLETMQPAEAHDDTDAFYNVGGGGDDHPAMPQDPNPPFGNQQDMTAGVVVDPAAAQAQDDGTF